MEENTRANKAKCKNGGLGSEDPAKKHQLAAVSDAITRTQTQEDSDIRADQKPSLSKPPSMERDGLTSSTAQLHGGARSPGSPLSTATRTTGLLAGGPVHAPDSLGNLCGLEQISKFAGLGVASHGDISTGVCSTSANGDSEFSWTLPHSNATTSLAPSSGIWSRLHPSYICTSPLRPGPELQAPPLPLPLTAREIWHPGKNRCTSASWICPRKCASWCTTT
ncbi:hypothetical protein PMIN06_003917 [Paraphaeosphaeria minitans]